MKLHSMFFRNGCLLPEGMRLEQAHFNQAWMCADDISPLGLDAVLRSAGWHFMWIEDAFSRFGCGRTEESAAYRAITRALRHVSSRFNAAEADSVTFSTFPGFRIAKATVHSRQIQQDCTLSGIDLAASREFPAR
jgi:hypothetical protein